MEVIKRKIVLAGDGTVGKTSLIHRFVDDAYSDDYISTLGTSVAEKRFATGDDTLVLMIWDLMGQVEMTGVQDLAFSNAKGALVVSDLTKPASVMKASYWIHRVHKVAGDIPMVLIGNKRDLVKENDTNIDMLTGLSNVIGFDYASTSALSGMGVQEAFELLVERMVTPITHNLVPEDFANIFSLDYDQEDNVDPLLRIEDQLVTAFTNCHGDQIFAMDLVRKQFELARVDFRNPGIAGILEIAMRLQKAATHFADREQAMLFIKAANNITQHLKDGG